MKGYIKEYVVYSTQVLVVLRFKRGNWVHTAANWRQKIIVRRILLHQESRQEKSHTLGMCRASWPWMSRSSHNKPVGMWWN